MKKSLFTVLAMLFVALCTFTLTSCGGDDDENAPSLPTVAEVQVVVNVTPTADMLKYCDLEIIYEGTDGTAKYATVNKEDYTAEISFKSFPVSGTMKYKCKQKSGVAPADDDVIKIDTHMTLSPVIRYSNGTTSKPAYSSTGSTMSFNGSKLSEWIEKHAIIKESRITINKDGEWI